MDTMTTTDYQIEEDEANRREACYDTALNEYLEIAEKIKQKFEHFLDDTPICDVDFNKLRIMFICYELMATDENTIPLCVEHHRGAQGIHHLGLKTWESAYGEQSHHLEYIDQKI